MDNSELIKFLMNQNSDLQSQISTLTPLNKELNDKVFLLLQNTQQNNCNDGSKYEKHLEDELLQLKLGNDNWKKFINEIPLQHINIKDVKFCELGYIDCYFEIIKKLIKNHPTRLINTIDKKNKIVCVYNDLKWSKMCFIDFIEDIKKLIFKIEKALIKNCILAKLTNDEQMLIMMDDTDKFKEAIARKVVEYCIIL